jgi:hypothetical protein
MIGNESIVLKHGWWIGLLFWNAFFILGVIQLPFLFAIAAVLYLLAVNAHSAHLLASNRPKYGRCAKQSSGSQAWWIWLWLAGLTACAVYELSGSSEFSGDFCYPLVVFLFVHRFLVRLGIGWEMEDENSDERDDQIEGRSVFVGYATLAIASLLTPFILGMGDVGANVGGRLQSWYFGYFAVCIAISMLAKQTYVVFEYRLETFLAMNSKERS